MSRYHQVYTVMVKPKKVHFARIIQYYTIKRTQWKAILGNEVHSLQWHSFYMDTNHHQASRQTNINHVHRQNIQIDMCNLH